MGYKEDGEDQGRRRTRSGSKPSPVATPPPAKKEKKAPKTPTTPSSGELNIVSNLIKYFENTKLCFFFSGRRGRPPKKSINDSSTENEDVEMKEEARTEAKSEEAKEESKPDEAAKEEKKEEKETEKENNDTNEPAKEKENHAGKNDSETTDESKASDWKKEM